MLALMIPLAACSGSDGASSSALSCDKTHSSARAATHARVNQLAADRGLPSTVNVGNGPGDWGSAFEFECSTGENLDSVNVEDMFTHWRATQTSDQQAQSTVASPVPAQPSPTSTSQDDLHYVGQVASSDAGTTLITHVQLGAIRYGESAAPGNDVLGVCNEVFLDSADTAAGAFAHAQFSVTYQRGRLPLDAEIGARSAGGDPGGYGDAPTSFLVVEVNGSWYCDPDKTPQVTFRPGDSQTFDAWVLFPHARSNTQSTLSQQELNHFGLTNWAWVPAAELNDRVSGPTAARCSDDQTYLMPYAKLPVRKETDSGTYGCRLIG